MEEVTEVMEEVYTDKIENSAIALVPTILYLKTPKVWQIPSENNIL